MNFYAKLRRGKVLSRGFSGSVSGVHEILISPREIIGKSGKAIKDLAAFIMRRGGAAVPGIRPQKKYKIGVLRGEAPKQGAWQSSAIISSPLSERADCRKSLKNGVSKEAEPLWQGVGGGAPASSRHS